MCGCNLFDGFREATGVGAIGWVGFVNLKLVGYIEV
jgi:hypothetical protein